MNSFVRVVLLAMLPSAWAWADSLSQLPASLVTFERPMFPIEVSAASIHEGFATVAFVVAADGKVQDSVVLEASHSAFGESVLLALPSWRFAPASSSDALPSREVIRFEFKQTGVVTSLSHRDSVKSAFASDRRLPIRTVTATQLSTPPVRQTTPKPKSKVPATGTASVSFVIDTTGRVRVPVVVDASHIELGREAVAVVKEWRYAPSIHEGKVVLVEDTRTLTFGGR